MNVKFNDNIVGLSQAGMDIWQFSEDCLLPLKNLLSFSGSTYSLVKTQQQSPLPGWALKKSYEQPSFIKKAVSISTYTTLFIFPAIAAYFVFIGAPVAFFVSSCILGSTPLVINLAISNFYRKKFPIPHQQHRQKREAHALPPVITKKIAHVSNQEDLSQLEDDSVTKTESKILPVIKPSFPNTKEKVEFLSNLPNAPLQKIERTEENLDNTFLYTPKIVSELAVPERESEIDAYHPPLIISEIDSFPPPIEKVSQQKQILISDFNEIWKQVKDSLENEDDDHMIEVFECAITGNFYTSVITSDDYPVFLLDDCGKIMSKAAAQNISSKLATAQKEAQRIAIEKAKNNDTSLDLVVPEAKDIKLPTGLNHNLLNEYRFVENMGYIEQMCYNPETKKISWKEALSGALLGEEGFKNPHLALDGYIYEPQTLFNYLDEELANLVANSEDGYLIEPVKIKSPKNPNFEFELGNYYLFPHTHLYAIAGIAQPFKKDPTDVTGQKKLPYSAKGPF